MLTVVVCSKRCSNKKIILAPKDIERKELMCTRKFVQGFNINIISSLEELLSHVNSICLSSGADTGGGLGGLKPP